MSDGGRFPGGPGTAHGQGWQPLPSPTMVTDETGWAAGSVMARRARAAARASQVWVTCRFLSVAVVEVCFLVPLLVWLNDDSAARRAVFYGNDPTEKVSTGLVLLFGLGLVVVLLFVIRPTSGRPMVLFLIGTCGNFLWQDSGAEKAVGNVYPSTGVGLTVLAGVTTLISAFALFPPPRPVVVRVLLALIWVAAWSWSGVVGQALAAIDGQIPGSSNPRAEHALGWLLIIGSVLMYFTVLPCLSPRSWRPSRPLGPAQPDLYGHLPDPPCG